MLFRSSICCFMTIATSAFQRSVSGAASRRGAIVGGFLAPSGAIFPPVAGKNIQSRTSRSSTPSSSFVGRRGGGGLWPFHGTIRLFSSTLSNSIPLRSQPPAVAKLQSFSGVGDATFKGDLLVLPAFQSEEDGDDVRLAVSGQAILAAWDEALGGAVTDLIETKDFKGKAGSVARVRLGRGAEVKSLTLVGMGKKSTFKNSRALGPAAATDIKAEKPKTIAVVLPSEDDLGLVSEEVLSGLYLDNRFKTGEGVEKAAQVESLTFFGAGEDQAPALRQAQAFAEGVRLTKDLVGAPANYVTPKALADTARAIAEEHAGWEVKVMGQRECEALKMGAYLAVAQGSKDPPEFIHLSYKPPGVPKKKLVLVGKGLTFDSGGYNLKAGAGSMIELMKFDMGGAGAVLGAAKVLVGLAPEGVEVHVIVAACENMISAQAYRPGDILQASNGKTIEVLNTDAEGRLTLADALVYAEKLKPDAIVDVATLTGACIIALGGDYGGMWTRDDTLASSLEAAASAKGERFWRMPLAEEYKPNIKSEIADLKNVGGREGGSITAALFLQEFVSKTTPWAHLDIAGPVWNPKKGGATGFGARTLAEWVLSQAKS